MSARTAILGFLLLGPLSAATARDTDSLDITPILRHDPFETPAVLDQPAVQAPPVQTAQKTPEPWERELRATSVSAVRSMINVDGVILLLGEELDGFRLVEVHERAAIFEKDGTRRTLSMDDTDLANARDGERN